MVAHFRSLLFTCSLHLADQLADKPFVDEFPG